MKRRLWSTCMIVALASGGSPLLADITAEEFLEEYISLAETFGTTVSIGSREMVGDTLNVQDFVVGADIPEGDGSVETRLDWMKIQQVTDDMVVVTMAPKMIFSMEVEDGGDTVNLFGKAEQQGFVLSVTGPRERRKYAYQAESYVLVYDELSVDGESIPMELSVAMNDLDGEYLIATPEPDTVDVEGAIDVGELSVNFDVADPDDVANNVKGGISYADLQIGFAGLIVPIEEDRNPLADGLAIVFDMEYGGTSFDVSGSADGDAFDLTGSDTGGAFAFELSPEVFHYGARATGVNYAIASSALPMPPVSLNISEFDFGMMLPLAKSDEPLEFSFLTAIKGFSVSDDIWNMIDGQQLLPRDPADIVIDIVGGIRWLVDLTDEAALEALDDGTPVELHDIELRDLTVSFAGAELLGEGQFTFDNTKTEMFDGFPQPEGSLDLSLTGANSLLDNLMALGLVDQDMGFAARAMMGIFARPGDGADHFVSTVEITPEGSIVANGQQIQ